MNQASCQGHAELIHEIKQTTKFLFKRSILILYFVNKEFHSGMRSRNNHWHSYYTFVYPFVKWIKKKGYRIYDLEFGYIQFVVRTRTFLVDVCWIFVNQYLVHVRVIPDVVKYMYLPLLTHVMMYHNIILPIDVRVYFGSVWRAIISWSCIGSNKLKFDLCVYIKSEWLCNIHTKK